MEWLSVIQIYGNRFTTETDYRNIQMSSSLVHQQSSASAAVLCFPSDSLALATQWLLSGEGERGHTNTQNVDDVIMMTSLARLLAQGVRDLCIHIRIIWVTGSNSNHSILMLFLPQTQKWHCAEKDAHRLIIAMLVPSEFHLVTPVPAKFIWEKAPLTYQGSPAGLT